MSDRAPIDLYEAGRKSVGLAYLLWFFLGAFGLHRFYLKRTASGWIQLAVHVGGWLLLGLAAWNAGHGAITRVDEPGLYVLTTSWTAMVSGGLLAWAGGMLLAIVWPWWIIDAFLIPGIAREFNRRLREVVGR